MLAYANISPRLRHMLTNAGRCWDMRLRKHMLGYASRFWDMLAYVENWRQAISQKCPVPVFHSFAFQWEMQDNRKVREAQEAYLQAVEEENAASANATSPTTASSNNASYVPWLPHAHTSPLRASRRSTNNVVQDDRPTELLNQRKMYPQDKSCAQRIWRTGGQDGHTHGLHILMYIIYIYIHKPRFKRWAYN